MPQMSLCVPAKISVLLLTPNGGTWVARSEATTGVWSQVEISPQPVHIIPIGNKVYANSLCAWGWILIVAYIHVYAHALRVELPKTSSAPYSVSLISTMVIRKVIRVRM